jgi:plasmid replication initiation protein
VVRLKSSYSIRLYEWAKRWQFAGKRRIELDELRQVLGAVELKNGRDQKISAGALQKPESPRN